MDTKQGPDDVVKRNVEDDTEGQRFTHRAIPDDQRGPEDVVRRNVDDDEDDTEGQQAKHR